MKLYKYKAYIYPMLTYASPPWYQTFSQLNGEKCNQCKTKFSEPLHISHGTSQTTL